MKKLIFSALALYSINLLACDSTLINFPKDCELQDRYVKAREVFRKNKLNITDVAEYKALRFIDRNSWERNLQTNKLAIKFIYQPAPATWNVWNAGINSIFTSDSSKNNLTRNLKQSDWLSDEYISKINEVLLTDGVTSIKDPGTDKFLQPGKMRHFMDGSVGFCGWEDRTEETRLIKNSNLSLKKFQENWENLAQKTLKEVVNEMGGKKANKATMEIDMISSGSPCNNGEGTFVFYTSSGKVVTSVSWIRSFLKYNLELYQKGEPILSPIELSSLIQKWFVSIHPFADGNGRTSRALQDLILANFDLPFAPGGDLQNDAMELMDTYSTNNYIKIENMVSLLESCAAKLNNGESLDYRCQQTVNINK